MSTPITEERLREAGFQWHQLERQPDKHWGLWLGSAIEDKLVSAEDLGIEVAPRWWKNSKGEQVGDVGTWHCWLRADTAGRYHRFIHVRPLRMMEELVSLVEALTGQPWNPANHLYGNVYRAKDAERLRRELERLDHRIREKSPKWHEAETDDTRGRALPEHLEEHIKRSSDQ